MAIFNSYFHITRGYLIFLGMVSHIFKGWLVNHRVVVLGRRNPQENLRRLQELLRQNCMSTEDLGITVSSLSELHERRTNLDDFDLRSNHGQLFLGLL